MARSRKPRLTLVGEDAAAEQTRQLRRLLESSFAELGRRITSASAMRPSAGVVYQQLLRSMYFQLTTEAASQEILNEQYQQCLPKIGRVRPAGAVTATTALAMELTDGLADNLRELVPDDSEGLQEQFEQVIGLHPRWAGDVLSLSEPASAERRRKGAFYTPHWIVDKVLQWTLPVDRQAVFIDPACGSGRFLTGALRHIEAGGKAGGTLGVQAWQRLKGQDLDPLAADLAATCLLQSRLSAGGVLPPERSVTQGDSLVNLPTLDNAGDSPTIVVGNPPFVNTIRKRNSNPQLMQYRQRFPLVSGAADISTYFLALAAELAGDDGRVGLVLPRAILNSAGASRLRRSLSGSLRPELIWAPDEPYQFSAAAVFFCVVVLGQSNTCRFSVHSQADENSFVEGEVRSDNWWSELCRVLYGTSTAAGERGCRLDQVFEVTAGLTAGEAYELRPHLVDDRAGQGQKLVTTGLIDPGTCHWGSRRCRFLKSDYKHPRVSRTADDVASLARRIRSSRRPKLIVAGLSRRLESFLDLDGDCLGSVSTYAITHPADDTAALEQLQHFLSSPAASELMFSELGAHALGGGNITVRKSFLRGMRLPDSFTSWAQPG